jgi:hypothetical protein
MPFEKGKTPEGAIPFKKGQSGNLAGRPKGTRNLSTLLREMLEQEITVTTEDGKTERKKLQEVLVSKLIKKAVKKEDLRAIQEIFDRTEGKPAQMISVNTISPEEVRELFPFGKDEEDKPEPESTT